MRNSRIMAKFKAMILDSWFVLLPVHLITSGVTFAAFYILCKSGIDVASILSR